MDKFLLPWTECQVGWFVYYARSLYKQPVFHVGVHTWSTNKSIPVYDGWKYFMRGTAIEQCTFPTAEQAMKAADEALIDLGYTLLTSDKVKVLELLQ